MADFKDYFTESIIKKAEKLIKKNGYVLLKGDKDIEIYIDEITDGWAFGMDRFDNDVEIDLNGKDKYTVLEGTVASDIAQASGKVGKLALFRKKKKEDEEDCDESAVGAVGRTDAKSALAHLSPELKKQFRKLLKAVGGKTVMRYLLADAPLQLGEGVSNYCDDARSSLEKIQGFASTSKRLKNAIDDVLDIMDTDC